MKKRWTLHKIKQKFFAKITRFFAGLVKIFNLSEKKSFCSRYWSVDLNFFSNMIFRYVQVLWIELFWTCHFKKTTSFCQLCLWKFLSRSFFLETLVGAFPILKTDHFSLVYKSFRNYFVLMWMTKIPASRWTRGKWAAFCLYISLLCVNTK